MMCAVPFGKAVGKSGIKRRAIGAVWPPLMIFLGMIKRELV